MKVLMINGSPHTNGNTKRLLLEMKNVFDAEQIDSEILEIGSSAIRGCAACGYCKSNGKCAFDDAVNEAAAKLKEADGLVLGTPVYYASANGTLVSFLDRLFCSAGSGLTMKVGASLAVARRSGTTATFDELNKYFTISGMPVASSSYWNNAYGAGAGECEKDEEGLQTVRVLAKNMVFLMKSIRLGKDTFGLPEPEAKIKTNFIR